MKVAILAGGRGSRLVEETALMPKPMIRIGEEPILLHIMRHYSHFGHNDFLVALGYRGEYIKRYMADYVQLSNNLTFRFGDGVVEQEGPELADWTVSLIETGLRANTGGRIKRLAPYLGDEPFMLTWGDGVSNLDLDALLDFHRSHGKIATLTAVRPPARFGHIELEDDRVSVFSEKPQAAEGWINGAFFVLEPEVFDYIDDDEAAIFEHEPLSRLAKDGQLMAYRHELFWQCMDNLRDRDLLNELWATGNAPWKLWD